MSARSLHHVPVALIVVVAAALAASLIAHLGAPQASEPARVVAAEQREAHARDAGYRVAAAIQGSARPAELIAEPGTAVDAAVPAVTTPRTVWDRLADCESGDWDRNRTPIPGTARWDYGLTFSHGDIFEGGPNFHPQTWDAYRDPAMPGHAGRATRAQQIEVAERVLADQGWGAWPVCSRKLGLR